MACPTTVPMHKRAKLWGVWLVPLIGGLVVTSGAYVSLGRAPADARKELSLALQALRSQAAEAALLAEQARRGDLARTFVREHARQLGTHMRTALVDVGAKGRDAAQPAVTAQAIDQGEIALAALQRIADAPAADPTLRDAGTTLSDTSRALTRLDTTVGQSAP
jgi:hypothetical protein